MTLEQRLAAPLLTKPEMCSLNMGTMNFGMFLLAKLRGAPDFRAQGRDLVQGLVC